MKRKLKKKITFFFLCLVKFKAHRKRILKSRSEKKKKKAFGGEKMAALETARISRQMPRTIGKMFQY